MKFSKNIIDDILFIKINTLIHLLSKHGDIIHLNFYKQLVHALSVLEKTYITKEKLISAICSEPEEAEEAESVHNEKILLLTKIDEISETEFYSFDDFFLTK